MIGIKSRGQANLADNGRREWDSEIVKSLDDEFPDWNYPKTTHMIPDELHKQGNDGERAEKVVFHLLKSFGEKRKEPMFVVHSYNFKERISEVKSNLLSSQKTWNIGEHDFVVIHRQFGLVFLQVKAAVKTAKTYSKAQKQLEKDRDSMKFFLEEVGIPKGKITRNSVDKLFSKFPGFVAMPYCPRPDSTASTYANGMFQEDCANVDTFSQWWDTNVGTALSGENEVIEDLFNLAVKRFVGLVLVSRCFASRHSIDDSFNALQLNTMEQLKVHLDSSADRWIVGPAGSGKTSLLMEKVILLAKEIISEALHQNILVVCYNKPLSLKLSRRIEHELKVVYEMYDKGQNGEVSSVVNVKTFDKLLKDINGSFKVEDGENRVTLALERLQRDTSSALRHCYDHIFVDEGQDLYNAKWPRLLQMMQKCSSGHPAVDDDDLNPRYFWVFYDSNQHLHLSKEKTHSPHSSKLRNSKRLHKVLRNTKKVFSQCNKYFEPLLKTSHPVGVYHREDGLDIEWDDSLQSEEIDRNINGELTIVKHVEYLKRNEVENADICVLVKDEDKRNNIISNLENVGIECQNAEELWTISDNNKVVIESIRRFKGLESKVVILYNPPFGAESKTRELLYTAISRCLCYLVVISTKEGCKALRSEAGFISGVHSGRPKPSQVLSREPVESRGSKGMGNASTSLEFPAKRHVPDDNDCNYNQLYKRVKELSGDIGGRLLGPRNGFVEDSVRSNECNKLLPSVWQHLQLFSEYKDVNQPALSKIVALLEYRVLQRSNTGNYLGNMENKKQEIDTSTQNGEMDVDVAGAFGLQKPSGGHR